MLLNKEVYITISHTPLKIDQHFPFKKEFLMSIKLNHSLEVALSKNAKNVFSDKSCYFYYPLKLTFTHQIFMENNKFENMLMQ